MGKIRRTFSIDFKMKAIELYSHRGIGSKLIGKELGVTYSVIDRWIKKYENEGILGLQEKRGRSKQTNEVSQDARIQRL
ncbi:helix-turn-helix domain-containing protein, partial [Bacillus cereus]